MHTKLTTPERLKDLRVVEKKLSLQELADATDIPSSTLGNYEKDENFMDKAEYFSLQAKLTAQYLAADKQLSPKRKMMFDIEKENLFTIASALRCVPKSNDKEEDDDNDLYN